MFIDEGAQAKTFIIFGRRTSTGSVPFFIWYALTLPNLSRQVSFLVCRWFVRRYGHVNCPRWQNVLFMLTCVSSKTSLLKLCCEVLNPESSNQSSPSMTSWKFRRTLQLESSWPVLIKTSKMAVTGLSFCSLSDRKFSEPRETRGWERWFCLFCFWLPWVSVNRLSVLGKGEKIARTGKGFASVTALNHFQGWTHVFLIKEAKFCPLTRWGRSLMIPD